MNYLNRKMFRDIIKMSRQFVAVLVMSFLCLFIYSGMEGIWRGLEHGVENYYEECNLADSWVFGDAVDNVQLEKINSLEGVKIAQGKTILELKCLPTDQEESTTIQMTMCSSNTTSKPKIIEGLDFNVTSDGIWLDCDYAQTHSININDAITLSVFNSEVEVKVVGLILHPEYIYYLESNDVVVPNHEDFGYAYINENFSSGIFSELKVNKIDLIFEDGYDEAHIKSEIENILGNQFRNYLTHENIYSIKAVDEKVLQIQRISVIYSLIFLLLSVLTILTTMRRMIAIQKLQIGTLKFLGLSKYQILLHYAFYGTFISVIGAGIGYLLGPRLLSPMLIKTQIQYYRIPDVASETTYISATLLGLVVVICTLAVVFAIYRNLKDTPAELLRNNIPDNSKHVLLERIPGLWSKSPFSWQWVLRKISMNKSRFFMGIIGIVGSIILISAGFGLQDSAEHSTTYLYNEIFLYDVKLSINEQLDSEGMLSEQANIQLIHEGLVTVRYNDIENVRRVMVLDEGDYVHIKCENEQYFDYTNDSAIITNEIAKLTGVSIGDDIEIATSNKNDFYIVHVGYIAHIPAPQGIILSRKTWEACGNQFVASAVLSSYGAADLIKDEPFVLNVINKTEQENSVDTFISSVAMIFNLLIVAAILLCITITYSLGSMGFSENQREYATLKVMGFKKREIILLTFLENIIIAFIALIIAVPVVYQFVNLFISIVSLETFSWLPLLKVERFLQAATMSLITSIVGNLLLITRIKKINMVESLKSMD